MNQRATLSIDSDILDDAPNAEFAVEEIDSNSDGNKVVKPMNKGHSIDNIKSIVLNENNGTAEILYDSGQNEQHEYQCHWWESANEVQIYGSSDDLVRFAGYHSKESMVHEEGTFEVLGTEFNVWYDKEGIWRFEVVDDQGVYEIKHSDTSVLDCFTDYSELLIIGSKNNQSSVEKLSN